MANVLCVLYDDPVGGYRPSYARDDIPKIERYYDGQATPSPKRIDFTPGELLGSVSGQLGLRKFLEERGHRLIVTSDKEGADSVFERELPDAEIVISQPFWPAYPTAGGRPRGHVGAAASRSALRWSAATARRRGPHRFRSRSPARRGHRRCSS